MGLGQMVVESLVSLEGVLHGVVEWEDALELV